MRRTVGRTPGNVGQSSQEPKSDKLSAFVSKEIKGKMRQRSMFDPIALWKGESDLSFN